MKYFDDKLDLVGFLIEQYELKRMHAKIKKIEAENKNEQHIAEKKK